MKLLNSTKDKMVKYSVQSDVRKSLSDSLTVINLSQCCIHTEYDAVKLHNADAWVQFRNAFQITLYAVCTSCIRVSMDES